VNVDRAKIQQDMNSIVQSISDIGTAAQFNGVNLLNNSSPAGLTVLTGLNRTSPTAETIGSYTASAQDLRTTTLAINSLNVTSGGSATFTPGATLAVADGNTITLTAGGIAHTFEFTDGSAALTTTDTATVTAHAVLFVAGDTTQQRLSKAFTAMRDAGFTVNTNEDGSFAIDHQQLTASATSVTGLTAGAVSNPSSVAFNAVNSAITTVNSAVAALGTASNSLDAAGKFNESLTNALTTGVGQLVDADLAEESANLQALQTRQQLGIQALSIANQQSGSILSLFRG
ncbi:MAG TPA: flagellin, partial [Ilumatobacteraceae bacterium]|nr:flagellin [Ilumatobacteraceae bacterium]